MKKRIAFLLAAIMVIGTCLTACGTKSAQETDASKQTEEKKAETVASQSVSEEASAEPELEEVTLKVWLMGPGKQADSDLVWEKFNEMLQEKVPNTTVEFTVISGGEYLEQWNRMLAAEETVDLAWLGWMHSIPNEAANGNILPLDDLLEEYGQGIIETLSPELIEAHRLTDGNIYHLMSWQGNVSRWGIYLPAEALEESVGVEWAEEFKQLRFKANEEATKEACVDVMVKFEEYLAALKEKDLIRGGMHPDTLQGLAQVNGQTFGSSYCYVAYGDNTFTVKSLFDEDNSYYDFCRIMAEYYEKGYIRQDVESADLTLQWDGGLTATDFISHHQSAVSENASEVVSAQYGMDITVVHDRSYCNVGNIVSGNATSMGIPYTAENPERAMMVLNEIYSDPDLYQLLIYGIEGTHWVDNGDGTATTLCGDGQATSDWAYGLYNWMIGTTLNGLTTQSDTPGYYEELKELEKDAYVSPFSSFILDSTNLQDITPNLSAIRGEYYNMLKQGYMGSDWEEYYNKFKTEMENAGLNEYIAEVQKQVDEYVAQTGCTW